MKKITKILTISALVLALATIFSSCRKGGPTDGDTTPDCYLKITGIPSGVSLTTCYLTDEAGNLSEFVNAGIVGAFEDNIAALIYVNTNTESGHYWSGGSKYVTIVGSNTASYMPIYLSTSSKITFSRGTKTMNYSDFNVNLMSY